MRSNDILLELNIINMPDLESWAHQIAARATFPEGKTWLADRIRRFLVNFEGTADQINTLTPNAPEWMVKRFQDGVELYRFRPTQEISTRFEHLADWLNSLYETAHQTDKTEPAQQALVAYAKGLLPKIGKLTIEGAEQHAVKWFERVNAANAASAGDYTDRAGQAFVMASQGGAWVELLTQDALKREGTEMGHCVGAGAYKVGPKSETRIFSFRDASNHPHVTVEMRGDVICQIKGKQNAAPVVKYQPAVADFLRHTGYRVSPGLSDLLNCGLVQKADGTVGTVRELGEVVESRDGMDLIRLDSNQGVANTEHNYYVYAGSERLVRFKIWGGAAMLDGPPSAPSLSAEMKAFRFIASFLNAMNPRPTGRDWAGNYTVMMIDPEQNRWGLIQDIAQHYTDWDGYDVQTYVSRDGHGRSTTTKKHYVFFENDENVLEVIVRDYSVNVSSRKVESAPSADSIAGFLNSIDAPKANGPVVYFGVWPGPDGWMKFDPAVFTEVHPGCQQVMPIVDGRLYGEISYSGNQHYRVYNQHGQCVGAVYRDGFSLSYDQSGAVHDETAESRKMLRRDSSGLAAWLNKLPAYEPNKDGVATLATWGLTKQKGKWVSVTEGNVLYHLENGHTARESNGVITLLDPKSSGVLMTIKKVGRMLKPQMPKPTRGGSWHGYPKGKPVYGNAMMALQDYYDGKGTKIEWEYPQFFFLYVSGVTDDPAREGYLARISTLYPPKDILVYEDGYWRETAYLGYDAVVDSALGHFSSPGMGRYAFVKNEDRIVYCRVLTKEKVVKAIMLLVDKKVVAADRDNIVPYVDRISDLMAKEGLTAEGTYFPARLGLMFKGGKLQQSDTNPRLAQFNKGAIAYEDGHRWTRINVADADNNTGWALFDENEQKMLQVTLDRDGVSTIHFTSRDVKRNPHGYLPYLHDLIDIVHDLNGGS